MTHYYLPPHVHFCCRGDSAVFLDLKHDDYILVSGSAAAQVRALSQTRQSPDDRNVCEPALRELLEGGLLTTEYGMGREVSPTQIDLASEALIDLESPPVANISADFFWSFVVACASAAISLRWRRIDSTVSRVRLRKARAVQHRSLDIARARELTAVFAKLRSFFPLNYLCLYDSLALIEFLARYDVFPTWVFGVRLEPWAAHCWVQHGSYIFNEGTEEAASYTPVMAA